MESQLQTQPAAEIAIVDHQDRSIAAAMHVGSVFAPILVPVIVYAVKAKSSKFIGAHARSAIFDAILFNSILAIALTVSFIYSAVKLWNLYQNDWQGFDWREFVVRFVVGWIILGLLSLINTAISLKQAYVAYHGRWPKGRIPR